MSQLDRQRPAVAPAGQNRQGGFRLDRTNAKVFGVCSGIGNTFGIDPMIVRAVFAIGTIVGLGSFILIYLAIALIAD